MIEVVLGFLGFGFCFVLFCFSQLASGFNYLWLPFRQWRRKWQPTQVFLPGESQGQRSLVGCRLQGHTESETTRATQQQQQHKQTNKQHSNTLRLLNRIWNKSPWKVIRKTRQDCLPANVYLSRFTWNLKMRNPRHFRDLLIKPLTLHKEIEAQRC